MTDKETTDLNPGPCPGGPCGPVPEKVATISALRPDLATAGLVVIDEHGS